MPNVCVLQEASGENAAALDFVAVGQLAMAVGAMAAGAHSWVRGLYPCASLEYLMLLELNFHNCCLKKLQVKYILSQLSFY